MSMVDADFLVIGAGIAGASAAYWLAPHGRVVILERESQPGYHSTGRSAALFMESYGTPQVRALTMASRAFLESPPPGFCDHPLLTPRGALMVATPAEAAQLQAHWQVLQQVSPRGQLLDAQAAFELTPILRRELLHGAVYEPDASDMDVHGLHQGYLRGVRRHGGQLLLNAEVQAMALDGRGWVVHTTVGTCRAPVVLNAAGAWADGIGHIAGARPIRLSPKRRSAFIFTLPEGLNASGWPMTIGVSEDWYIKPDAGMILGSPANADPVPPQDVQPEAWDIALAIDRIQTMTTLQIQRPTRTWAGLRSFVADGDLVGGWDAQIPGFFWVAAQGGYGIQTSPAMGEACALLARGVALSGHLQSFGLTPSMLAPDRLHAQTP